MSTVVSKNVQIGADGTASNNFTIYQPESPDGTLRIGNGNSGTTSAQVVLTSAGNVGIGTSAPPKALSIQSGANTAETIAIEAMSGFTGGGTTTTMRLTNSNGFGSSAGAVEVKSARDASGTGSSFVVSSSNPSSAVVERMRIDSSGNLLVGTTSGAQRLVVASPANNVAACLLTSSNSGDVGRSMLVVTKFDNNTTTSQVFVGFTINNGANGSGQINANGAGAAAFGSFSDARLKENIQDLPPQLDNITALRPVEFDYIESEGGGHQIGFIAQEMQAVYPDAVNERQPDGMLTVTGWSKTEARLVKAIQELKAELDAVKAQLATPSA